MNQPVSIDPHDSTRIPLAVDLDGTLVATDTLWLSFVQAIRCNPLHCFVLFFAMVRGRAYFKDTLASICLPNPQDLPYRPEVLKYIKDAKENGRNVYLVTAAEQRIANLVATHLGIFDEAIGTQAGHNLKSSHKAAFLVERFGAGGFEYVGDSSADLKVWKEAGIATVVAAKKSVRQALLAQRPEATILVE